MEDNEGDDEASSEDDHIGEVYVEDASSVDDQADNDVIISNSNSNSNTGTPIQQSSSDSDPFCPLKIDIPIVVQSTAQYRESLTCHRGRPPFLDVHHFSTGQNHTYVQQESWTQLSRSVPGHSIMQASIVIPVEMILPIAHHKQQQQDQYSTEQLQYQLQNDAMAEHSNHYKKKINPDSSITTSSKYSTNTSSESPTTILPPTYSIQQSKMSLYAAFPPPPVILSSYHHYGNSSDDDVDGREDTHNNKNNSKYNYIDKSLLKEAKQRLQQHSGFHGAIGVTSTTWKELGYADTIVSVNYRLPILISIPMSPQNMIGNIHSNVQLGSTPRVSLGGSLSSLDGKTHFRWDADNLLCTLYHHIYRYSKTHYSHTLAPLTTMPLPTCDYVLSGTHDFSFKDKYRTPFVRLHLLMKLSPFSQIYPKTWVLWPTPHFSLVLTNLNYSPLQNGSSSKTENDRIPMTRHSAQNAAFDYRPKVSLSIGYGNPLLGGEKNYWSHCSDFQKQQSLSEVYGSDMDRIYDSRSDKSNLPISSSFSSSSTLKLDMEQRLTRSQSCHSFMEYSHCHGRPVFSLGTMITRSFSSSRFSRLGVGLRQSFGTLWNCDSSSQGGWWSTGITWWLFQLERGDVRLCIPFSIHPMASSPWDLFHRLVYASLVSMVVDVIVGELLCDAASSSSMLRKRFLRVVLGKVYSMQQKEEDAQEQQLRQSLEEEKICMWEQHWSKARSDALVQRNLMSRQAELIAKKEDDQGGLLIIKALYGVIESRNRQRIHCSSVKDDNNGAGMISEWYTMDVTVQLQFWVVNSALCMPADSKRHMIGFYDVLGSVSNRDWMAEDDSTASLQDTEGDAIRLGTQGFGICARRMLQWWKKKWTTSDERPKKLRDLVAVLSIRYKYENRIYDVIFHDDEPVYLPSALSQEVLVSE